MLVELRVENHRSLLSEQVFSLEAARLGGASDPRPRSIDGHDVPLLPAAVIYGANASGKSNVLSALAFMREAVVSSHRQGDPDGGVPRSPFAWAGMRQQPSMFEVVFVLDGTKFEYGFCLSDTVVEEEWLFASPMNRRQLWFERDGQSFKFGDNLKGPNQVTREVTRANALFLSASAQNAHSMLTPIYSWFQRCVSFNISSQPRYRISSPSFSTFFFSAQEERSLFNHEEPDSTLTDQIRQLLRSADIGIVDVKNSISEHEIDGRTFRRARVLLQHAEGDDDSWLDFEHESEGTKTLFRLAPSVFRVLESGGVLFVDELESSLHPLLGLAIVKLFNSPTSNPKNAQLLFTTHDTNLLGNTIGEPPLRRDQIWFAEKDRVGASRIYPLTDYKPRQVENLERGYLQGRYGAVPFLGDFSWMKE